MRTTILDGIDRIARAEAAASRAPQPPDLECIESAPAVVNDAAAAARTITALQSVVGPQGVIDGGSVTGSEDVGVLATAAEAPIVFWLLGGADPALFAEARTQAELLTVLAGVPSNHSPHYAPVEHPTLEVGARALCAAAREWLGTSD